MYQLYIPGYQGKSSFNLKGLASRKKIDSLSQKRVTRKVREVLRRQFGEDNVQVSCGATYQNNRWIGKCVINNKTYQWEIL